MNFNVKEYENSLLIFILQLTIRKLPVVELGCSIRNNIHHYLKKASKRLPPFPATYVCEARFSSYISTKTAYRNRMNAKADVRL